VTRDYEEKQLNFRYDQQLLLKPDNPFEYNPQLLLTQSDVQSASLVIVVERLVLSQ
jgi:hypothetical protein